MKIEGSSLCTKTLDLLRNRGQIRLLDVHRETGIGFWWLKCFLAGKIPNPGVNNVQALYEYLTKRKLDV